MVRVGKSKIHFSIDNFYSVEYGPSFTFNSALGRN